MALEFCTDHGVTLVSKEWLGGTDAGAKGINADSIRALGPSIGVWTTAHVDLRAGDLIPGDYDYIETPVPIIYGEEKAFPAGT